MKKPLQILGPEVSIIDLIDGGMIEDQSKKIEDRTKGIKYHPLRPSAAGHCARKLALELEEFRGLRFHNKPELETNVMRLFSLGHSVEASVINHLIKFSGLEVKYRQQCVDICKLPTGELIEGSIDLVLQGGKYAFIADVKSKKDNWSQGFKSKWEELHEDFSKLPSLVKFSDTGFYAENLEALIEDLRGDFMIDNLLQLNLYANSNFCLDRNINIATLLYYNKNSSHMFELRFKPSAKVAQQTHEKFAFVAEVVRDGKTDELECSFQIGTQRHAFCDCHKILPYLPENPTSYYFGNLPKKVWPKDSNRFKQAQVLESLYSEWNEGKSIESEVQDLEQKIIKIMLDEKTPKVKFTDGSIWEAKFLKTPREHYELRRTKL